MDATCPTLSSPPYPPRSPEQTLLYEVLSTHFESFLERAVADGRSLPAFVVREGNAEARGIEVYCTDMFDDLWEPETSEDLGGQIDDIVNYPFIDASQVNSRSRGDGVREHSQHHWDRVRFIVESASGVQRPINHTKVYDEGYYGHTPDGPIMGMHRMTLDLLAGSATARFHRTEPVFPIEHQRVVRALRMVESAVHFWEVEANEGLLSERSEGEAFAAADPGRSYLLYFPEGGSVGLDLSDFADREFSLDWVDLRSASYGTASTVAGGAVASITAPDGGAWVAIITR